jgi:maltoporin
LNLALTQPDAIFWAGESYYRRQHVDIDDFYPLDLSGYGAGFEDLSGKLAVSVSGRLAAGYHNPEWQLLKEQH